MRACERRSSTGRRWRSASTRDDTIVQRRLAQKMEFLFEDVGGTARAHGRRAQRVVREATPSASRSRRAPRSGISTSLPTGGRGRGGRRGARAWTLAAEPGDSPDASALGDPFMFQDYYGDRAPDDVAKTFGPGFARAVFQLTPGAWAGPIESGYGWHLVWVDAMTPARAPALEEVAAGLSGRGGSRSSAVELRETAFAAMRARYEVVVPKDLSVTDLAALSPGEISRLAIVPQ